MRLAYRASAADLRRVLEAAPYPEIDAVVSMPAQGCRGLRFTDVAATPFGSEPAHALPAALPRRRRKKRDDRFVRLGWAIAETSRYLCFTLQLQRSRIARWLGKRF